MFKRVISAIVVLTFICSLGPLPSAMALRQEVGQGKAVGAVGDDIKEAATPAADSVGKAMGKFGTDKPDEFFEVCNNLIEARCEVVVVDADRTSTSYRRIDAVVQVGAGVIIDVYTGAGETRTITSDEFVFIGKPELAREYIVGDQSEKLFAIAEAIVLQIETSGISFTNLAISKSGYQYYDGEWKRLPDASPAPEFVSILQSLGISSIGMDPMLFKTEEGQIFLRNAFKNVVAVRNFLSKWAEKHPYNQYYYYKDEKLIGSGLLFTGSFIGLGSRQLYTITFKSPSTLSGDTEVGDVDLAAAVGTGAAPAAGKEVKEKVRDVIGAQLEKARALLGAVEAEIPLLRTQFEAAETAIYQDVTLKEDRKVEKLGKLNPFQPVTEKVDAYLHDAAAVKRAEEKRSQFANEVDKQVHQAALTTLTQLHAVISEAVLGMKATTDEREVLDILKMHVGTLEGSYRTAQEAVGGESVDAVASAEAVGIYDESYFSALKADDRISQVDIIVKGKPIERPFTRDCISIGSNGVTITTRGVKGWDKPSVSHPRFVNYNDIKYVQVQLRDGGGWAIKYLPVGNIESFDNIAVDNRVMIHYHAGRSPTEGEYNEGFITGTVIDKTDDVLILQVAEGGEVTVRQLPDGYVKIDKTERMRGNDGRPFILEDADVYELKTLNSSVAAAAIGTDNPDKFGEVMQLLNQLGQRRGGTYFTMTVILKNGERFNNLRGRSVDQDFVYYYQSHVNYLSGIFQKFRKADVAFVGTKEAADERGESMQPGAGAKVAADAVAGKLAGVFTALDTREREIHGNRVAVLQVSNEQGSSSVYKYSIPQSPGLFLQAFTTPANRGLLSSTEYPPDELTALMQAHRISQIDYLRPVFGNRCRAALSSQSEHLRSIVSELGIKLLQDNGNENVWFRGPAKFGCVGLVFNLRHGMDPTGQRPDGSLILTVRTYPEVRLGLGNFLRGNAYAKIGRLNGIEVVAAATRTEETTKASADGDDEVIVEVEGPPTLLGARDGQLGHVEIFSYKDLRYGGRQYIVFGDGTVSPRKGGFHSSQEREDIRTAPKVVSALADYRRHALANDLVNEMVPEDTKGLQCRVEVGGRQIDVYKDGRLVALDGQPVSPDTETAIMRKVFPEGVFSTSAASAIGVAEAIARIEASLATLPKRNAGLAVNTVRRQLSQIKLRLEAMPKTPGAVIEDARLAADIDTYCATAEQWARQTAAKVEALRKTLPVLMIYDDGFTVVRTEPIDYFTNAEHRVYSGPDVQHIAQGQKILLIADTGNEQEARAAEREILLLGNTGIKAENITIATSREDIEKAIAENDFAYVVKVGKISYELEGLNLPVVSMEYTTDKVILRGHLADATLTSSV